MGGSLPTPTGPDVLVANLTEGFASESSVWNLGCKVNGEPTDDIGWLGKNGYIGWGPYQL